MKMSLFHLIIFFHQRKKSSLTVLFFQPFKNISLLLSDLCLLTGNPVIQIVPQQIMHCFSLAALNNFFLCLSFQQSISKVSRSRLLCAFLVRSLLHFNMLVCQIQEVFGHFFNSLLLLLSFWDSENTNIRFFFVIAPWVPKVLLTFFSFPQSSFCCQVR